MDGNRVARLLCLDEQGPPHSSGAHRQSFRNVTGQCSTEADLLFRGGVWLEEQIPEGETREGLSLSLSGSSLLSASGLLPSARPFHHSFLSASEPAGHGLKT